MTDELRRRRFLAGLGFSVDDFQLQAFDAVDDGRNVLVSAPTGSGKTLVATYAIERQLDLEQRSFYTTPLKALSNQKYHELARRYGESRVGLLTGDTSINHDAAIVVMTTEVLRNMLLTESRHVSRLGLVVLDEVHYLQDPFRGGVWEEVIILTPSTVRLVALSATISNAPVLGEWLESVRGPTDVVVEKVRPIRLHNHVALHRRGVDHCELIDLLDGSKLSEESKKVDVLMRQTRKFRPGPQWRGPRSSAPPSPIRGPLRGDLLRAMDDADLLPAIVFIFSRAACNDAVGQVRRDGLGFTGSDERRRIKAIAFERVADFSTEDLGALEFDGFLDCLEHGIAAHHAGMVPAFREIVEACFEANLMGVVFATETLSLGVNMPARSVVLERFSKYSDAGRKTLTSGEFAQMTGRAGRRGLDDEGHAVVAFSIGTSLTEVGRVALSDPPDLHSSFRPTYNLTANLMHHFDRETARQILCQSFAQFETDRRSGHPRRSLSDMLESRCRVLEELGHAKGWNLTETGRILRSLYHECDLLIVESLLLGAFDGAEPAVLAGVLSSLAFEDRRATRRGPHRRTPPRKRRSTNDRLGPQRREELFRRIGLVNAAAARVVESEGRHLVPGTRAPDGGFATTIAAWVRGAPLLSVLELSGEDGDEMPPGDFVRNAKQVADLCEQLARHGGELGESAARAKEAIVRSVVAGNSMVPPTVDGAP